MVVNFFDLEEVDVLLTSEDRLDPGGHVIKTTRSLTLECFEILWTTIFERDNKSELRKNALTMER